MTASDIALLCMLLSIFLFWLLIIVAIVYTVRCRIVSYKEYQARKKKEKFSITADNLLDLD